MLRATTSDCDSADDSLALNQPTERSNCNRGGDITKSVSHILVNCLVRARQLSRRTQRTALITTVASSYLK